MPEKSGLVEIFLKRLGFDDFMADQPHHHTGFKAYVKDVYEHHYMRLLWITVVMVLFAVAQISYQMYTTGDFIHRGVSLKGGIVMTIPNAVADTAKLHDDLQAAFPKADLEVRSLSRTKGISVEASEVDPDAMIKAVSSRLGGLTKDDFSAEVIGSSLGKSFFRELFFSIGVAFVLMGIVVLLFYRTIVPSCAVILSAFCDMLITIAILNLTGFTMSSAGIAALLMLIGYSVDTDMLLTSRVLRRKEGSVMDRVYSALKTGLTEVATTTCAILVGLMVSQSGVIREVMFVLLVGLIVDIPMTWVQNVAILRKYMEKKGHE